MNKEDFEKLKKDLTNLIAKILGIFIGVMALIIGVILTFTITNSKDIGETKGKVGELKIQVDQQALLISQHNKVLEEIKSKALKKEQFTLSAKIIYLKIDKTIAIVEGRENEIASIDREIRNCEIKLNTLDTDDVTRGIESK